MLKCGAQPSSTQEVYWHLKGRYSSQSGSKVILLKTISRGSPHSEWFTVWITLSKIHEAQWSLRLALVWLESHNHKRLGLTVCGNEMCTNWAKSIQTLHLSIFPSLRKRHSELTESAPGHENTKKCESITVHQHKEEEHRNTALVFCMLVTS